MRIIFHLSHERDFPTQETHNNAFLRPSCERERSRKVSEISIKY